MAAPEPPEIQIQTPDEPPAEPIGDEGRDEYVREVHDLGLGFDLSTMTRRRMLMGVTSAGVLAVVGGAMAEPAAAACLEEVEPEIDGPYPADGSNGVEVRTASGIVRSDITRSFGTSTTVAPGVPLTLSLVVQDLNCMPLAGAAVYVWHCDRDGNYSLYSTGVTQENYLRGIQQADGTGKVTFTTIFPACYEGRWPHIHFQVYSSLADATSGAGPIRKISQIALPESACDEVYASAGYSASTGKLSRVTLSSDLVFNDDLAARELPATTGSVSAGYQASLTVAVDPAKTETGGFPPIVLPTFQLPALPTLPPPPTRHKHRHKPRWWWPF